MKELNKDSKRRDEILGISEEETYDTAHFDMTLETLETLVKENFADPDDAQNCAPTIQNILEFMRNNPRFTCNGYAVNIRRGDYRISIEGVDLNATPTDREREDFIDLFRHADEFVCNSNGCHCWFD